MVAHHPLILASASPRRRELLSALDLPFTVQPGQADETLPAGVPLAEGLCRVAERKARQVLDHRPAPAWVLGADTAVVVDDTVFGKPRDPAEARRMLGVLSGRTHQVVTGVVLRGPETRLSVAVTTDVHLRTLTAAEILWYTNLDEPYDKAGGYAIQGRGAFLVAAIHGSYTNVVGLPMHETVDLLEKAGILGWNGSAPLEATGGA